MVEGKKCSSILAKKDSDLQEILISSFLQF